MAENVALRQGKWNKKEFSKAQGLFGRTLGLIGFGNVAQEVARRAHAFGMPVIAWSRRSTTGADARKKAIDDFDIDVVSSPEMVLARADIVSIHLALSPETRGFVNLDLLRHAKRVRS